MDKIRVPQWIFNFILVAFMGVIGVLYGSILDRVSTVEAGVLKNETRIETLNPILTQIQIDLSDIKANILWLKKNQ